MSWILVPYCIPSFDFDVVEAHPILHFFAPSHRTQLACSGSETVHRNLDRCSFCLETVQRSPVGAPHGDGEC